MHPTAVVSPEAELAAGVSVEAFAIIGPRVVIGAGSVVGPRAFVERDTRIGPECRLGHGAVLGTDPQDRKYAGERTSLRVGARCVVREFATINRGTRAGGRTVLGDDCLVMAYCHVAHDCRLGNEVVLANGCQLAGHVELGDRSTLSGLVAVHQFVRIGARAFVGGCSRISRDVAPYCAAIGNPVARHYGLNSVGLQRSGASKEARAQLKRAYAILFRSEYSLGQAMLRIEADKSLRCKEVEGLVRFLGESKRGLTG